MNRPAARIRFERPSSARFSADEFLRMADVGAFEDMKVELDHGELIRMNPPYTAHAACQMRIGTALVEAVKARPLTVVGEVTVRLDDETVRGLDAAVIDSASVSEQVLEPGHIRVGIEISDTTLETDLGPKLRDYASAGIATYWVVDLNARAVHVMIEPDGNGYRSRTLVRFGEPLTLPDGLGTIVLD
ncbi:MAG: Uma2 family endonuclease [Allosphingosinicella sp.]